MSELWMEAHMLIVLLACWSLQYSGSSGVFWPAIDFFAGRCSLCKIPLSSCDFILNRSVI